MTILLVLAYTLTAPTEPAALSAQLQQQIAHGKWTEAAETVRLLDMAVAQKAPLVVTDAHMLKEVPDGMGIYTAIADGVVRTDEALFYAEVHEHSVRKNGNRYEIWLVSDFVITDANGKEIAKDDNFGEQRFSAATPHRDTYLTSVLRVVGLPSGRYNVRWTIRDRIGEKAGTVTIPFVIP